MPRKLRFMKEPYALREVTIRCFQDRFLLKPSPEVNDLILGIIGRALSKFPDVRIYSFKFLSNHFHLILAAMNRKVLAAFMAHINGNIAREIGSINKWQCKFWSRRYTDLEILDDEESLKRMKYVMSQGCKEGLVARVTDWPGASTDRALIGGKKLRGTWYDRSAYYKASRRGKQVSINDYAIKYEVPLTPLPAISDRTPAQQRAFYRQMASDIDQETSQVHGHNQTQPIGARAVQNTDPHSRPRKPKRSPRPLCHTSSARKRTEYKRAYQSFVNAFRHAVELLKGGAKNVQFPADSFIPTIACETQMEFSAAPG